ncbi:serine peptidase [Rickettsia conorii subsp. heilongjiangensis]|uniref:Probable periplasmic serine endoprotease DegP-like n=1 Tax=Rickettsia conorii subsp. heilongjiangensis TaxID=226665 RepID=A0AAD1GHK7_RICCR|nr:Do family serine endopeptidase [Rickettsia conorii]AEK74207.1 endopeptidase [Rickettsia conorii subsp. heilongjiangensis 054]BBM90996.1 serine peptidase [Rickettsia conorii subsp. heilongjiangensis]BBM92205.1 serine peptidase [Rickettsia conorii subsp. heilongjiangensis]BBM93414.1 serine peptidase [Rickettsia conorii subsp. heilongjiangensis]BBM94623.1 serine peptidase [Rickettsia conorii subsp. heilongjiangensis]
MVNLKIVLVIIVLISSNVVLAKENSKFLKVAAQEENEFTEINSAPLKVSEAARYSFADIVEPLIPAVVNISTIEYVNSKSENAEKDPLQEKVNDFLEKLNIQLNLEEVDQTPKSVPLGSGFIIEPNGLIVTNYHVIANVDKINIKLADNTELSAKLIGNDTKTDLALLKIDSEEPLPFVEFGDSNDARVGDWVIAIGNPFGNLGGTVTSGIISSKGRDIDIDTDNIVDNFIQTDAAINNGNSGGPMFNLDQKVIGVNTAIFSPLGTNIGIGFAIPSNTAKPIIERLKKDGKVSRGRLGVTIQDLTEEISEGLGLKNTRGVLVAKVQEDGPGDKAGIKTGDIIIEFADIPVKNTKKLRVIIADAPIDQEVKVKILRDKKELELPIKITSDNEEVTKDSTEETNKKEITNKEENNLSITKNNITFGNLTEELRQKYTIPQDKMGIVITNIDEEESSFKIGDLITNINQESIDDISKLEELYENAKKSDKQNILLLIERGSSNMFVPLQVM